MFIIVLNTQNVTMWKISTILNVSCRTISNIAHFLHKKHNLQKMAVGGKWQLGKCQLGDVPVGGLTRKIESLDEP